MLGFRRGFIFSVSLSLCFFASFVTGCASSKPSFPFHHPETEFHEPIYLLEKVNEIEKQDFENIHLETLGKDVLSSHHLVVIRQKEELHYHADHDLSAMVIKGRGILTVGEHQFGVGPGSSVYIPRGLPHQVVVQGKGPVAALVIFTPPFDGKDMIPVPEK